MKNTIMIVDSVPMGDGCVGPSLGSHTNDQVHWCVHYVLVPTELVLIYSRIQFLDIETKVGHSMN